MTLLRILTLTTIAAGTIAIVWLAKAEAHQAPTGWTFDPACCGNGDCYPVQSEAFEETPNGYRIKATGEVIPYESTKVRPSPDGLPYRCSVAGKVEANTFCIYVSKGGV